MKAIKGPSINLAQFSDARPPFNQLASIASWTGGLGFRAVQIPGWDQRLRAAESQIYCDDVTGILAERGLVISELTTHVFGRSYPSSLRTYPNDDRPGYRCIPGAPACRAAGFS